MLAADTKSVLLDLENVESFPKLTAAQEREEPTEFMDGLVEQLHSVTFSFPEASSS